MSESVGQSERDAARDQLDAAASGSRDGEVISRSAERMGGAYASIIGVLIGAFLLGVVYVFPTRIPWLVVLVTLAYGGGLGVASLWYIRRRRATGRGWARRYRIGFVVSIVLYAVGIAVSVSTESHDPRFWIPYAVATALPLIAAGLVRGQL
ncbi:MAG: hypothetical protein ACYCZY_07720 [Lacisediminihabitans sp.]